jgi:hypothetical protein
MEIPEDTVMELFRCKRSFYRTALLAWFSVSLFGQMIGASPITPLTAAQSPDLGLGPQGPDHMKIIAAREETKDRQDSITQTDNESSQSSASRKRGSAILKANVEKMKRDAGELADLVKALQEELNKSDANMLPLGVVQKAGKIEKLAKRIKGTAHGF